MFKIQVEIGRDAELARRFRTTMKMVIFATLTGYAIAIVLLFLAFRLLLDAAALGLDNWWILAGAITVGAATQFRRLDDVPVIGFLIRTLRWISGTAAVILCLGLIVYVWWIVLLLLALIGLGYALALRRKSRAGRRQYSTVSTGSAVPMRVPELAAGVTPMTVDSDAHNRES